MTNSSNRTPRPHRTSRKHSQTRRQAAASTAPERQEPQRTENIEKMAAVYDSAVYQREAEEVARENKFWEAHYAATLTNLERELLDPHVYIMQQTTDASVYAV